MQHAASSAGVLWKTRRRAGVESLERTGRPNACRGLGDGHAAEPVRRFAARDPPDRHVVNPATEEPIAELEQAGVEETDAAVARAREAFPAWRSVAPADRARLLLRRLATLVEEHGEELARIESRNVGKPIAGRAARSRWSQRSSTSTPGAVDKHYGETIPVAGRRRPDVPRAARRRRADRAVELPAQHRELEARARRSRAATPSCSSRRS